MNFSSVISSLSSIRSFDTMDSFDTVIAIDSSNDITSPSQTLQELTNLLATSEEWQVNGDATFMKNNHVLEMLSLHLPSMEDSAQLQVIDRLICFAEYSDMNKWIMFKTNITSKLLTTIIWKSWNRSEVAEKTMRLLEIICSYSVKVSDVKLILNKICNKNDGDVSPHQEESAWYQGALLKLLYSIAPKQNTMDFIYFKGIESGIELSPIEKFPANGYSFFTWIKMDATPSPKEHVEHGDYIPRLFSFFAESGDGIEAYFENNELCFHCKRGEIVSRAVMSNFKFTQKRWYFIVVVHQPEKRGWTITPSELNVVVDGQINFRARLEYPVDLYSKNIPSFSHCSVGASMSISPPQSPDSDHSNASTSSSGLHNCFRGQMTSLYMINDVLTKEQIIALYELGPNHSTQFEPDQKKDILSACNLFDGTLGPRMVFNFHVKASSGQKCFNLASRNLVTNTREMISATLFGIEKCSTLSLRNAIQCLGDVEILFPIIMRFDDLNSVSLQAPFGSQDNFFASVGPCKAFFDLLSSLLQSNTKSQNHIIKSRGIKIISLLLQQVGPSHFSISAFKSMIILASSLEANEDLAREIYLNLVFEFRLWMYASMGIQRYCIEFLKNFIDSRKQMCRELFGVQYILDILSSVYWYKQNELSSPDRHPTANSARPKPSLVKQLREMLLGIIVNYFKDGIFKDEVLGIFRNLLISEDDEHIYEILNLLLNLLTSGSNKSMVDIFASYGGFEILCELLKRKDESVKVLCIRLITCLINSQHTPSRIVDKLRFENTDPLNLIKLLEGTPFTLPIYHSLLSWALEQFNMPGSPDKDTESSSAYLTIKNFNIIIVTLALLDCDGTKPTVQCRVLEDLVKMFRQNISFCNELHRIWNWQKYLFRLIPIYGSQDEMHVKKGSKDTADWALELVATVTWNMFEVDLTAYKIVEDTIISIWMSGRPDAIEVIRAFLTQMLLFTTREMRNSFGASFAKIKRENVTRLMSMAEEILFNHRDLAQTMVQRQSSSNGFKSSGSYPSSIRSAYESTMPSFNMLRFEETVISKIESNFSVFSSQKYEDMVFQSASNPWEENRELAEMYLEIVDGLDSNGNWKMELTANRNETPPGDNCRMVLRVLISGITLHDHVLREKSLEKLMEFVERHVRVPSASPKDEQKLLDNFYCHDSEVFEQHIFTVLGEIHEAFMQVL
ncbi:12970_t:CDS:2, partial [Acaulospora colombiana]